MLILFLISAMAGEASAEGKSVEDLIGVFSMQKQIVLGSSSSCFGSCQVPDSLAVSGNPMADSQAPGLAGFDIESGAQAPSSARPAAQMVNFTLHAIDDQSGLSSCTAYFSSPSGEQSASVSFSAADLTSGGGKDGRYKSSLVLPPEIEPGVWQLQNLTMLDRNGNSRTWQAIDVRGLGMPDSFQVE